jgi:hypothetical protein
MAKKKDEAATSAKATASKKVESKVEANKPAGPDSPAPDNWRDHLPVHPAAELFPLMSPAELKELAEDIEKNGLNERVAVWRKDSNSPWQLLDGRNRLDALGRRAHAGDVKELDSSIDPYAYVISANIKRRHLTTEQKRELIAKLLKAQPEKSNRQIAETVKASHNTVGVVRDKLEGRGQIDHVEKRTDTKGRDQPARKGGGKSSSAATKAAEKTAKAAAKKAAVVAAAGADAGSNSASEAERLRTRNEELENIKSHLEKQNLALKSEVEEAKAGAHLGKDIRDFIAALVKRVTGMSDAQRARVISALYQALSPDLSTPPPDDGLDIPANLLRRPS